MYAFTRNAADPGGGATGWNDYGAIQSDLYAGGEYLYISLYGEGLREFEREGVRIRGAGGP